MLKFRQPWQPAFMPLVPEASSGRRGVFSQTSQPETICRAHVHVVVLDEDQVALAGRCICSGE